MKKGQFLGSLQKLKVTSAAPTCNIFFSISRAFVLQNGICSKSALVSRWFPGEEWVGFGAGRSGSMWQLILGPFLNVEGSSRDGNEGGNQREGWFSALYPHDCDLQTSLQKVLK